MTTEQRLQEIRELLSLNVPALDRLNPEYAEAIRHIDFLLNLVDSQVAERFEAKLLGFGEGDRIKLCEPCLRQAMADNLVSFSSATPGAKAL